MQADKITLSSLHSISGMSYFDPQNRLDSAYFIEYTANIKPAILLGFSPNN